MDLRPADGLSRSSGSQSPPQKDWGIRLANVPFPEMWRVQSHPNRQGLRPAPVRRTLPRRARPKPPQKKGIKTASSEADTAAPLRFPKPPKKEGIKTGFIYIN
jgi:hypothetical protein